MLSLRPLKRGFLIVWPDETLTDSLGQPGDFALVMQSGAAPFVYGPKAPAKTGKLRGVWPVATSLQGAPGSAGLADWVTTTVYSSGATAMFNKRLYRALAAHTSGAAFRTDLAAAKWEHVNPPTPQIWSGDSIHAATTTSGWGSANRIVYMRADRGGTISQVGFNVQTASGNVAVAAYADNAGVPGTLLSSSGIVTCPAVPGAAGDLSNVALGSTVGFAAGDWLALWCDNTTMAPRSFNGLNTSGTTFTRRASFENTLAGGPPATATPTVGTGRTPLLIAS